MEIERVQQRQSRTAAVGPVPSGATPDSCSYSFTFGTWQTVDSVGGIGTLRFGVNSAGHISGCWEIPPVDEKHSTEYQGQVATQHADVDEEDDFEDDKELMKLIEEETDFVGLGPAWFEGQENEASRQPRMSDGSRGNSVSIPVVAAPGYCYSFRGGRNLVTTITQGIEILCPLLLYSAGTGVLHPTIPWRILFCGV